MKPAAQNSVLSLWKRFAKRRAFTLVEVLVASSVAGVAIVGTLLFTRFVRISITGVTSQMMVSNAAGNAMATLRSRIRVSTSTTVDATGNTLTLGFDDNNAVDSDGDGSFYNDKDHYETFVFSGTNSTNWATASSNRIIYTPRVGVARTSTLISSGVRNLPNQKIFAVPYPGVVVIRFGVVDVGARDRFQSIDVQATGLSLNRPASNTVISILP
jgi:prepilin-type N-terminal cleavage/methylation domain-containing protein